MMAATVRSATSGRWARMSAITSGERRTPCPAVRRGVREAIVPLIVPYAQNRATDSPVRIMSLSHRSGMLDVREPTTAASPTPWRALRAQLGRVAEAASSPLVPADFLDLFAPLRRGAELRGRVVSVHAETPGRGHPADQARRRLGRPRARPVPPHRHRRRRRPPVARLLADPRPPARRADLDHRQGRPRRPGQPPPRARLPARHPRPPRAGPGRVRAPPTAAASCSSSPPAPASRR